MTKNLRIWHGEKHDDATVTVYPAPSGVCFTIHEIQKVGGFWTDDNNFVPWHRITWIQVEEEAQ